MGSKKKKGTCRGPTPSNEVTLQSKKGKSKDEKDLPSTKQTSQRIGQPNGGNGSTNIRLQPKLKVLPKKGIKEEMVETAGRGREDGVSPQGTEGHHCPGEKKVALPSISGVEKPEKQGKAKKEGKTRKGGEKKG